jgi:hypothetical protein
MMPGCIGSVGCIVVIDLPSPIVPAAPVNRVFAVWSGNGSDLAGRSVEPELSPPIRKA